MNDLQDIDMTIAGIRSAMASGVDPLDLVAESCRRVRDTQWREMFTELASEDTCLAKARQAVAEADAGVPKPLLGVTFSVKDNIHVACMTTTSNCPGLALRPTETALCVARLEAAGAVLIGKNTMDQFATGLNGTRSPEPLCRNAIDPRYIPGGSSSGSAVAVARGIVAFSLGSDTGGSGRVPAACNGIVGLKPSLGVVSTRGVLFNSRFFDCVPVFAHSVDEAFEVLGLIAGYDAQDPLSKPDARDALEGRISPMRRALAIPKMDMLRFFGDDNARDAHMCNLDLLRKAGWHLEEIDFSPFEEVGRLVFNSAMVAERLVDYGQVFRDRPETIHPVVKAAIEPGFNYSAQDAFEAIYEVNRYRRLAQEILAPYEALVVPTIPTIFTIESMLEDPLGRNAIMGTYTYFANPMDLCAISTPGIPRKDSLPSALCFLSTTGRDGVLAQVARQFGSDVIASH